MQPQGGPYIGPAQLLDQAGSKLADVRLSALADHGGEGVLPEWDGERLIGRPAWKGSATAAGVDWKALVARREPVTVLVGTRSAAAVVTYEIDGEGMLHGGPPAPW